MAIKDSLKEGATKTAKGVKNFIDDVKDYTENTAAPAIKDAANKAKEKTQELGAAAKENTVKKLDLNGDGEINQEDMIVLLDNIYGQSINGIKNISKPVKDICDEYLDRYKDPRKAASKLVVSDITKCTTSGFLSGLGGAIALPVTLAAIPANITSVLYVQVRMIASVAYLAGLDVNSDATQTFVYACLAGVSVADCVKGAGIKLGTKLATNAIDQIPGKALTVINQKVGFRMLTKFGEKGIFNLGKMVPVLGGVIGGGFDLIQTKFIANRAIKEFFDGDYEIKENVSKEAIEAEFKKLLN